MSLGNYVIRGGSWDDGPEYLRLANRDRDNPNKRYNYLGFRVIRKPNITTDHTTRGGSCNYYPVSLRSAYRFRHFSDYPLKYIGFRVTKR